MQKIIIKTDSAKPDSFLISCLRSLFPDCEIHVLHDKGDSRSRVNLYKSQTRIDTVIDPTGLEPET